jgi:23S rRNA (guanosine2251-2'-O)-methyltransferase
MTSDWIGGVHAVLEALENRPGQVLEVVLGRSPKKGAGRTVAEAARRAGAKFRTVRPTELEALVPGVNHQGVVCRIGIVRTVTLLELLQSGPPARVAVLDQVTDPRNLGAILRAAWALGIGAVVITKHRSAGLTATTVKTAAGAAEHVPVCRVTNLVQALETMKEAGYWIYGAHAEGDSPIDQLAVAEPAALVLGAEGSGLRPSVKKACDVLVSIPMNASAGSLNVAVAAGILFHRLGSL